MSNRKLDDRILGDLKWARNFLTDESKWCRHNFYKDEKGRPVVAEDAYSACIIGALELARHQHITNFELQDNGPYNFIKDHSRPRRKFQTLSAWNDYTATHKDILDFLDSAIETRKTMLMERVNV